MPAGATGLAAGLVAAAFSCSIIAWMRLLSMPPIPPILIVFSCP
jgi:hypothetical protein